jgi:hypothetical protein
VKGSDLLTLPEKRERREPQSPDDERSDTVWVHAGGTWKGLEPPKVPMNSQIVKIHQDL